MCWLFIIPYVLIDSLSGFFSLSLGIDLKISLLFKLVVFFLCFLFILKKNKVTSNFLMCFLFFLFFISFYHFLIHGDSALSIEFVFSMKVFSIILMFLFAFEAFEYNKSLFIKNAHFCLYLGFWIVVANVLSGYLGFGQPTYASSQVGFKGFFVAGNELSALFIVLSAYKLQFVLIQQNKFAYLSYSLIVILVGVSIGSKSGIIFSLFLPFVLLVLNSKRPLFSVISIFIFTAIVCCSFYFYLDFSIDSLPALSKVIYNYNDGGLERLIFSGRDDWVTTIVGSISDNSFFMRFLLGFGSAFILDNIGKHIVEVDPIDIYLLFGVLPLFIMILFSLFTFYIAIKNFRKPFGPAVLLVNLGLFLFAIIAGHVWTSGMIGISWALLNVFSSTKLSDIELNDKLSDV